MNFYKFITQLKQMIKLILFIPLFLVSLSVKAQKQARIENEIRRLEQMVVNGILEGDTASLKKLWVPEFMVNTPRNTIAVNRDAVFDVQKKGLIDYSSLERIIEEVLVQKNIAITMGYETFVPRVDLPDAKAGQAVKRRFTNVWMYKKGKWQQVARHASIICK